MAYIDGNFTAAFLCSNSISYPLNVPNNGGTREYSLSYYQYANTFADKAIGSTSGDAPGSFLTEQGKLVKVGAGVVRFDETYTEIPQTWGEKEQLAYTYPGLTSPLGATTWNPYGTRSPITLYAVATVVHEYFQGSSPTPNTVFIVTDNTVAVDYIGVTNPNLAAAGGFTSPVSEPNSYLVSSEVRLWKGDIWERISKTVPRP